MEKTYVRTCFQLHVLKDISSMHMHAYGKRRNNLFIETYPFWIIFYQPPMNIYIYIYYNLRQLPSSDELSSLRGEAHCCFLQVLVQKRGGRGGRKREVNSRLHSYVNCNTHYGLRSELISKEPAERNDFVCSTIYAILIAMMIRLRFFVLLDPLVSWEKRSGKRK